MPQRRELVRRGIAGTGPDLVPVRHVERRGDHVAAELAEGVAFEQRCPDGECDHHREQRRQESPGPTDPELLHVDGRGPFLLRDQQQRDQVAGDDEEDLDTEVTAGQPVRVCVVHHHRDDRDRPHTVEARKVGDPADGVARRTSSHTRGRPRRSSRRGSRCVSCRSHSEPVSLKRWSARGSCRSRRRTPAG